MPFRRHPTRRVLRQFADDAAELIRSLDEDLARFREEDGQVWDGDRYDDGLTELHRAAMELLHDMAPHGRPGRARFPSPLKD